MEILKFTSRSFVEKGFCNKSSLVYKYILSSDTAISPQGPFFSCYDALPSNFMIFIGTWSLPSFQENVNVQMSIFPVKVPS